MRKLNSGAGFRFYNGLQSSSTTLEIVGIGEEDDPLLAMQGLRTLYAATLPAIDPDTLTCEPARAAWRHMQEEATYTDPARAEQTLRTLRALAGQESAESDLYQFFSGNVNWARQLLAAMSVQWAAMRPPARNAWKRCGRITATKTSLRCAARPISPPAAARWPRP